MDFVTWAADNIPSLIQYQFKQKGNCCWDRLNGRSQGIVQEGEAVEGSSHSLHRSGKRQYTSQGLEDRHDVGTSQIPASKDSQRLAVDQRPRARHDAEMQ